MKDTKRKYGSSSFWMSSPDENILKQNMSQKQAEVFDVYRLATQKRAISNFVSILTGDKIPVKFNVRGNSYTDGEQVVISSRLSDPKDFDVACGLALHEGSHIVLSDFDLLRNLRSTLKEKNVYLRQKSKCDERQIPYLYTVKSILNYIEDRRIDKYVYDRAPGYRSYYHAMYDKYFNDRVIDKALVTDEYTEENIDSYMFRIINLHSKNSRLDALDGLKEIYSIIDFHNIDRLKTSSDALDDAIKVVDVLLKHIPVPKTETESQSDEDGNSGKSGDGQSTTTEMVPSTDSGDEPDEDGDQEIDQGGDEDGEEPESKSGGSTDEEDSDEDEDSESGGKTGKDDSDEENESDSDEDGEGEDDPDDEDLDDSESNLDSTGTNTDNDDEGDDESNEEDDEESKKVELTDRQKRIIGKRIKKQRKFIDGDVQKTQISKSEEQEIKLIDETDSEIVTVGEDLTLYNRHGARCVVIKNMTRSYCESSSFPFSGYYGSGDRNSENVTRGIQLGSILAKKLQVHAESRTTQFTRQKTGKIDKRLIASLGFGNESVFYRSETDEYNDVNLHISIDASSSMSSGSKWEKTMTNTVAITKACESIENINVQVSFRGVTRVGREDTLPVVMVAYDSRVDSFRKVRNLFKFIHPTGTTPEGLCFEAIKKLIVESSNNLDSYFLNISDGHPNFYSNEISYSGSAAYKHTFEQVKNLQRRGLKVLSYFVSTGQAKEHEGFNMSYGKTAKYIDVLNMMEVGKTMNKLFLEK